MKCDRLGGGECLARGATYQAVADRILPELDHLGAVLERLGKLAMGGRHGLSRPRRCAPRSASALSMGLISEQDPKKIQTRMLDVDRPHAKKHPLLNLS